MIGLDRRLAGWLLNSKLPSQRSTVEGITAQLRAYIIDGTFAPGSQLKEAPLSTEFQVSRGPIREALQRLVQEGLVIANRNRGMFVTVVSKEDIKDVYKARKSIESEAITKIIQYVDKHSVIINRLNENIESMATLSNKIGQKVIVDSDFQFHSLLVKSLESKRLERTFDTLLTETRVYLVGFEATYPSRERLVDGHCQLLNVMQKGEVIQALQLISEQLEHEIRVLINSTID